MIRSDRLLQLLLVLLTLVALGAAVSLASGETLDAGATAVALDAGAGSGSNSAVPPTTTGDQISALVGAIRDGQWLLAAGLLIMLLVAGLRLAANRLGWVSTKWGGYAITGGVALLAVVGADLIATQTWHWGVLWDALLAALAASGLWEGAKDLAKQPPATPSA